MSSDKRDMHAAMKLREEHRNHGSVLDRAQVIREGDHVILMFNQGLTDVCITSMREYLTDKFPGIEWTFAENCNGAVVYRGNSGS